VLKKQKLKFQVFGLVLLVLICLSAQILAQKSATYTNPVQAGDYPDPSVIRVGKNFYATATSSEWGPEFPILHSRDLVNWNIVGVVFPKRPEWSVGNYWAPEIWQENGKFYIFYVARRKDGPLCIAAATAAKPTDLTLTTARWSVRKSARLTLSQFVMKTENYSSSGKKTATV
jgi:beta-xylosidase